MIKTLSKFLVISLLLLFNVSVFAQSKIIKDVLSVKLRNSGAIYEAGAIKGYYFFYEVDKVNRKTRVYELSILDANLNPIGKKKITDTKYVALLEAEYNGKSLMFKFYDYRKKMKIYRHYDRDAKLIGEEIREPGSKMEGRMYVPGKETTNKFLTAIPNKGFLAKSIVKNKSTGFTFEFFPSDKSAKKWTFKTDPKLNKTSDGNLLASNDKMAFFNVIRRPSLMSKKFTYYTLGVDLATGKELFDNELSDPKFELMPLNGYTNDKGEIALIGLFFKKGSKVMKAKSLGMFSFTLDEKGNIKTRNYASWAKDVGKFLPISDRGKIKDVGYLFFHKFIQTKDGRVFGIAEQYKKAASGVGIAANLLGGGRSNVSVVKIVVEDLMIFEFSPTFELQGVKTIDKFKSNVQLPNGLGMYSSTLIAHYLNYYNSFDYSFTQTHDDGEAFSIGYVDYDKSIKKKSGKSKSFFGSISYADGEYTTDKVNFARKSYARVMPAKTGYIMITEYFRKEKKLEMRLEKLNF